MEKENSSAYRNSLVSSKHGILRSKLLKGTVPLGKLFFCLNISFSLKKSATNFYLHLFIHFLFVCLFVY